MCHFQWEMVTVLMEIERESVYKTMRCSDLFTYAVEQLELTNSVAHGFQTVCRKAIAVPALAEALEAGKFSVNLATRMVSAMTNENATELIEFAVTHTQRELDFEVARL